MITGRQIKAARALLEWDAEDLANQAGISRDTVFNIENGKVQSHRDTLERIQKVIEAAGIEFLPGSGLRVKDRIVETYEGKEANRVLLDDVYKTLRDIGGEVLISGVIEKLAVEDLGEAFLMEHIARLNKAGIKERMLIQKGDTDFTVSPECYRWVEPQYFSPHSMYIYGPKLGLVSWAPRGRSVIIHDEGFAESTRRLFNFVWDRSEKPVLDSPKNRGGKNGSRN